MDITVNALLNSNCNLKNVTPICGDLFHSIKDNLTHAYTSSFKHCIYGVWTQEKPYKQYIVVVDLNTMKVIY